MQIDRYGSIIFEMFQVEVCAQAQGRAYKKKFNWCFPYHLIGNLYAIHNTFYSAADQITPNSFNMLRTVNQKITIY